MSTRKGSFLSGRVMRIYSKKLGSFFVRTIFSLLLVSFLTSCIPFFFFSPCFFIRIGVLMLPWSVVTGTVPRTSCVWVRIGLFRKSRTLVFAAVVVLVSLLVSCAFVASHTFACIMYMACMDLILLLLQFRTTIACSLHSLISSQTHVSIHPSLNLTTNRIKIFFYA